MVVRDMRDLRRSITAATISLIKAPGSLNACIAAGIVISARSGNSLRRI